ncbi:patched domain-containing protein 3-like isoform X2 [Cherax quadricarinatus]|uniref:patched domain-containing protein 3-like isoform X2 n=1 Tax=Cherax quadricarinatus TaxID=27406 RepID=UPI00387E7E26
MFFSSMMTRSSLHPTLAPSSRLPSPMGTCVVRWCEERSEAGPAFPCTSCLRGAACTQCTHKLNNIMGCFLKKFDNFLNRSFYKLGFTIANHYGYFIIVPVFLSAILATGFQRIKYEDDPEYLFSPTTGFARNERAIIEENFFLNFSSDFHPSRITRTGRFARLIITAKDEGTLLRAHVWDDMIKLNQLVHSVSVDLENDRHVRYDDLCAIWDSKCYENNVLGLQDFMPRIENGTFNLTYPLMLNPTTFETYVFPHFFGGTVLTNDSMVVSVKALSIFYWLKTNTAKQDADASLWEEALLKEMDNRDFGSISVARFVSRTLETELENNTNSVVPFIGVTLTIMILFSVCSVMMGDWVRTKPWLGFLGVISANLACAASFGFLIYLGVEFIGINMASPFLMLGIGIDDTFVMLAAWRRTRLQDSVQERMAHTFAEAAVSITITSLTDMISFFVGAITPFPCVQIFCLYTGTAVLVTYAWHITFFGGCLALAGFMEKEQRHGITCRKIKPLSEAVDDGCCYRTFCTGGISEADPWNPIDNKPHAFMVFFRDYVARFLNIPAIKALVIMVFLMYLMVACWGCTMVKEGLERRRLSRDDSYSVHFYDSEDKYFREYPYRIQVAITGDVTYSDPETQKELMALHKKFEGLSYSGGALYTESWLRAWLGFLERNQEYLDINITSEADFCAHLKELYLSGPANPFAQDVKFNENSTRIIASRFIVQTYKILDANADKDMMEAFRKVASDSKFNVTVFNPFFIYFDQYVLVRTTSIQAICLAAGIMMVVSLIFIPNPLCSLWVAFSIVSIEIGVVGYMTLWGVNLDSISMINLIMCIGFSVDFSAHISYAYLAAKVDTPDERVQECLYALGVPIIQGGLSTILGITALILAPSYIFITFFKTVFLVIFFGALHGILLLPVLLSLMGPGSCSKKKPTKHQPPSKTNGHPFFVHGQEISPTGHIDPNSLKIPRPHSVPAAHNGAAPSQVGPVALSRSGAFLASGANAMLASSKEDGNCLEKDLGLGTSGEESSESSLSKGVITRRSGSDIANGTGGRHGLPILEVYSNNGYISDDLEAEERRGKEHRLDRYGEWEDPRRSYHEQRSSAKYSSDHRHGSSRALDQEQPRHSSSRERNVHRSGSSVAHGQRTSSEPRGRYRDHK